MLPDPSQVVGYVRVDSGLVAVTTARTPADDTSQGELVLAIPFFTYQGTPGVTLGRGDKQLVTLVLWLIGRSRAPARTPGLTWQASVPPSMKPAQSIPGRMASPCMSELEQRSWEMKGTRASCRKLAYSSAPANPGT